MHIGQVDGAIMREIGIENHLHQTGMLAGKDLRHATDARRLRPICVDVLKPAGTFGDQHAALGEEHNRPGVLERTGDADDTEIRRAAYRRLPGDSVWALPGAVNSRNALKNNAGDPTP